jgi:sulfur-oxidizing protein SoxA
MRGVAASYPKFRADLARPLTLRQQINACRARGGAPALGTDDDAMLAITALVGLQSRGMPVAVDTSGPARAAYDAGARFFEQRQGQLNLACGQCHDDNAGRRLRGDVISNGLGTGYPAYRLEWNSMGSLHRRLRACSLGVRATQFPLGSREYLTLELYLAHRARGMPVEAPGLRR